MKYILYIFIVMATFTISSCGNSSTKNSQDDDTMNEDPVVVEEIEYVDTTKLFAEQEKQGVRDVYAKYTFNDGIRDYTITLKTDNTVVFEGESSPMRYGSWRSGYPDGIELEFSYKNCPIVGGERCTFPVLRDGYFYINIQDAAAKNPDMRCALKKIN